MKGNAYVANVDQPEGFIKPEPGKDVTGCDTSKCSIAGTSNNEVKYSDNTEPPKD